MRIKKVIFSLVTTFIVAISSSLTAFAAEAPQLIDAEKYSKMYDVTTDELLNLEENIDKALSQISSIELGDEITVPVSENLKLTMSLSESNGLQSRATTYQQTITSTVEITNLFNITIITLQSVGIFNINGTTSTPVDAYGLHTAFVWNVTVSTPTLGQAAYNSYVRNTFSGQLNIGIDPIDMNIQSFTHACTIFCNAVGTYSASWS